MCTKKNSAHPLARSKRGASTIISTIIITGTLLIILVIASFASANVLDLQIANTEFEQAKTNMLTLDEVIQDVALRRGSGGYVQFNQRSGGIGINVTTQKLKVLGPAQRTMIPKSPTNTSGTWSSPQNAYIDGSGNASSSTDSAKQSYSGYGFDIMANSTIISVRVRLDAWTTGNEKIRLNVSIDGGSSWLASGWLSDTLLPTETTYWVDITNWTAWTPSKINNDKIWTRVELVASGSASQTLLDWIPVEVTFDPPLSPIYESSNLVGILYRGGSKVSGTDLDLRGTNALTVSMADPLGYVRVAVDNGLKIKLDYYRIRIATNSILMIGSAFYNCTQITFINIINGPMGGTDVVNFKVQNIEVNTYTKNYTSNDVTIYAQLGTGPQVPIRLYSPTEGMSNPINTAIIFTEVKILVSTS